MLINSPNISGSLNVSGNTVITGSLTTSIAALNTPATTFLTSNNGTIRSRTAAQTLSDIGAQATGSYLTVATASSTYVTIATDQSITGVKTFTKDIIVNGINIGLGAGNIDTNTRVGTAALLSNTTGFFNVALGRNASTSNTTGNSNTSLGYNALYSGATASYNTAVGALALESITGGGNVALGNAAGRLTTANAINTTSTNSIYIGNDSSPSASGNTNEIIIGHGLDGNGSNTVTIGNSSITNNYFTGNIRGGAFIKSSGTSTQFLKADGSVDSSSYLTTSSAASTYLPLTGGTITGSLTVTGDVIAQTLNVQQVTSSIVYSSGSNVFGNSVSNTQQFTGSMLVTGSLNVTGTGTFSSTVTAGSGLINGTTDAFFDLNRSASGNAGRVRFQTAGTDEFEIGLKGGVAGFHIAKGDATELVTVLTSGNVGIGTTVPSAGLEIETDGSAKTALRVTSNQAFNASPVTAIMFRYRISSGTTIGGAVINAAKDNATENNQAGNLQFWTNNGSTLAERMRITSAGRVGIGETTPVSSLVVSTPSDTSSLGSSGIVIQGSSTLTAGNVMALSFTAIPGTTRARAAVGSVVGSDWGKGNLTFYTRDASDGTSLSTADERMRITSGGNVGIGITTPSERLEVNGSLRLIDGNADGPQLKLASSGFSDWNIDNFSGNLRAYYGSTEYLRVTSGGNVGIGTTSPGAKLAVGGSFMCNSNQVAFTSTTYSSFSSGNADYPVTFITPGGTFVSDTYIVTVSTVDPSSSTNRRFAQSIIQIMRNNSSATSVVHNLQNISNGSIATVTFSAESLTVSGFTLRVAFGGASNATIMIQASSQAGISSI